MPIIRSFKLPEKKRKNYFSIITKPLWFNTNFFFGKNRSKLALWEWFAQVKKLTDKMRIIMHCNDLQFLRVFIIHES